MIRSIQSRLLLSLAASYLLSGPLVAHKLNAAETSVDFNKRTKNLEIIHSFYLHDVNHLVQKYYSANKTQIAKDKNKVFADYIRNNLSLDVEGAKPLKIKFIGTNSDKKKFYIYHEIEGVNPSEIKRLTIDIEAMTHKWKPKYWLFNVGFTGENKSFVLGTQQTRKVLSYE